MLLIGKDCLNLRLLVQNFIFDRCPLITKVGGGRVDFRDAVRPLALRVQEPNGDVQEDHQARPYHSKVSFYRDFS